MRTLHPAAIAISLALCGTLLAPVLHAQDFTYNPPGQLMPGSGEGRVDDTVYVPGMRFPIENAPAYANSPYYGNGGAGGPGGSQCDAVNYSYPWWDNYCETRVWEMPMCPAGTGHQGQDIRPSTCEKIHWAVAAEAGTITSIGSYSVYLTTAAGTIHGYLHMEPSSLTVSVGDTVNRGDRLGQVSDAFGGTPTHIHLHYTIEMNVEGYGFVYAPTYMSLIRSYEALIGQEGSIHTCGEVPPEGQIIDNKDPCLVLHGPTSTWRYVETAGYDGDLWWSYVWESPASNWAEWLLYFERSGSYEVEVYITPAYAQSQETRYSVLAGSEEVEFRVNQSSGDGWLSIGTFDFVAGIQQNVAVYDGPGEPISDYRQFVVDAIRLTPTDLPEPDPDPVEVGPPDVAPDLPDVGEPDLEPVADAPAIPDLTETEPPLTAVDVTVNQGCGCASAPRSSRTGAFLLVALLVSLSQRRRRSAG